MKFFEELELLVEKLVHPEAKAALAGIAAALTADIPALQAEFAASGSGITTFLSTKLSTLLSGEPAVAPFVGYIMQLAGPFISKEIGYGETDVTAGVQKLAAWLIAEEAVV